MLIGRSEVSLTACGRMVTSLGVILGVIVSLSSYPCGIVVSRQDIELAMDQDELGNRVQCLAEAMIGRGFRLSSGIDHGLGTRMENYHESTLMVRRSDSVVTRGELIVGHS